MSARDADASAGVRLTRLAIRSFRNLKAVELEPAAGANLISGPNGAGKTSLLEAIHVLAQARSFRAGRVQSLISRGADALQVAGTLSGRGGRVADLKVLRSAQQRQLQLNRTEEKRVAPLAAQLPVLVFEPHAHALVEGGPEERRRLLDWGLFHVEPHFLEVWRRFNRALRQRNAALRLGDGDAGRAWLAAFTEYGERLARMRAAYARALGAQFTRCLAELAPELGDLESYYRRGWPDDIGLEAAVCRARVQERRAGYTVVGPHRADLRLSMAGLPAARRLSRGQEKLAALGLLLAQAHLFRETSGPCPVLLFDDLPSELDRTHLERAVRAASGLGCQSFVTSLEWHPSFEAWNAPQRRFHVEQGEVRLMV